MRPIDGRFLVACALLTGACAPDATAPRAALEAVAPAPSADFARWDEGGDAEDFERFVLGGIDGQFDWKSFGGAGATAPGSHCAVYDHVIGANAAIGVSDRDFDRRSLRISNAVTTGCYGDQTFSARAADVAGQAGAVSRSRDGTVDYARPGAALQNRLDAEWLFRSAVPDAVQPGLEVVVSPARGDDHRMSWVQMQDLPGGIAIRVAARADAANPGAFQITTIATGLSRRREHAIRVVMDFVDGPTNDVVRVYVDGDLRYTGRSWETYYQLDPNGALNFGGNPPAINRLMFRTGSDLLRGVPGDAAPATLGRGFVFDQVRTDVYSVARVREDCRNGGWRALRDDDGRAFRNQGDCISAAVRDGR